MPWRRRARWALYVVRIARAVRAALAPRWYDEEDLLTAATEALETGLHLDTAAVIVHLPQQLSFAGAGLLTALAARRRVILNVGCTGVARADRRVIEACARAGVDVDPPALERPVASRVVSVSDPDEEARAAIRLITGWMRDGVRLGRVAVLYGTADPYACLLQEHLDAYRLPHNGAPVRAVGEMLVGRTLRALLSLPDRDFRRSEVLALITGSPLRDGNRLAPGRAWERISRAAGVVGGADWRERLSLFASQQRGMAQEAQRTEDQPRAAHLRHDALRADELVAFVERLRGDLVAIASSTTWVEMAGVATRLLDEYLGGERMRWRWNEEERRAGERVGATLDRLGSLDVLGGPAPTLDVFQRALDVELEATLGRVGHFGDGVLTGPVSMAVGLDLDRVVVLGMAEGSFPVTRLDDSLLPDDDRRAAGGELSLRQDAIHDDHRYLLAAVAAAPEAVFIFPRGDLRRHGDRSASRWLLADAAQRSHRDAVFTADLPSLAGSWLTTVASYAAGLATTDFPATEQEMRLASMLRDPATVADTDRVVSLGMELASSRGSERFTRFDGNLAGCELPDYTSTAVTSATRLQAWAACPHAFLMQYLLGVEVAEDPERLLEMSPLEKGSLIHEILDRFVKEQIAQHSSGPWEGAARDRLNAIAREMCESYAKRGLTGRSLFWRRDQSRILADLARFATVDQGRPIHAELEFGRARFELPDGRTVAFKGAIDRIDELPGGGVKVIDYKTGRAQHYRGLSEANPHDGGSRLQLAIYGVAAEQHLDTTSVEAGYWFVTGRGGFEWIGYPVSAQVRREAGKAIAAICDAIREGLFPRRPPERPAYAWVDCWFCAPDGLSTAEARRDWERKRHDPCFAEYVGLVEPEALDGAR